MAITKNRDRIKRARTGNKSGKADVRAANKLNYYAKQVNTLLKAGHSYADILQMTYLQIDAYTRAAEYVEAENTVLLMNITAVAFGGTAKDRREIANILLGEQKPPLSTTELQKMLGGDFLATPIIKDANEQEMKDWAARELANNPELKKKLYGR
jgi:hypothetical protein